MRRAELRETQAPLKARYRTDPQAAVVTMHAAATLGDDVTCSLETVGGHVTAGLHPAAGGDGDAACSGDMLLQALAACAGVTLGAVATSLGLELRGGTVEVAGDLDFRGTLGVDRDAPVGFRDVRIRFVLDSDASADELDRLVRLTERYCVVLQTIARAPEVAVEHVRAGAPD